jgi:hypothetical protein
MNKYHVEEITRRPEMQDFVTKWHYSAVLPRQTKLCIGGFRDMDLKAAVSFGWGTRPLHTIRKLFPSLGVKDYLDIGKMCLENDEPKNSESMFLSQAIRILKIKRPDVKVLFTWADAMWGKPGYIYQASNFLYGGHIWTDVYRTADGKRLHPLQLQSERRLRGLPIAHRTQRPSWAEMQELGWRHYFGKQFRYVNFLCPLAERSRLLQESPFGWNTNYPKDKDCEWKIQTEIGRIACEKPQFTSAWSRVRSVARKIVRLLGALKFIFSKQRGLSPCATNSQTGPKTRAEFHRARRLAWQGLRTKMGRVGD